MKKATTVAGNVLIMIIGAGFIIGALFLLLGAGHPKKASLSGTKRDKSSFVVQEAKNILTKERAAIITGKGATEVVAPDAKTAIYNVSYVSYSGSNGLASLTVRSPLGMKIATANDRQFEAAKPANATDVRDLSDAAYWDGKYHQLNILKHDTWYVVAAGPPDMNSRTLQQTQKFAESLIDKF